MFPCICICIALASSRDLVINPTGVRPQILWGQLEHRLQHRGADHPALPQAGDYLFAAARLLRRLPCRWHRVVVNQQSLLADPVAVVALDLDVVHRLDNSTRRIPQACVAASPCRGRRGASAALLLLPPEAIFS